MSHFATQKFIRTYINIFVADQDVLYNTPDKSDIKEKNTD